MQKYCYIFTLLSALMLLGSCKSEGDAPIGYQQVCGEWYLEKQESGRCVDIASDDEQAEVTYDQVGMLVSLDKGFGSWTNYYVKDGELAGYDGRYFSSFAYTIDEKGYLHFTAEKDSDSEGWTQMEPLGLRYDAGDDVIRSQRTDGAAMTFHRLSAKQQEKLAAWDAIIDNDHIGQDDSAYETDIDPDHATEPSRTRSPHP